MASDYAVRIVFVVGLGVLGWGLTYVNRSLQEPPPPPDAPKAKPGDAPPGPPAGVPRVYSLGDGGSANQLPTYDATAEGPAPKPGTVAAMVRSDPATAVATEVDEVEEVDIDELPDEASPMWALAGGSALGVGALAVGVAAWRRRRDSVRIERTRGLVPGLGGEGDKPLDTLPDVPTEDVGALRIRDPLFSRVAVTTWVGHVVRAAFTRPDDPLLQIAMTPAARSELAQLAESALSTQGVVIESIRLALTRSPSEQLLVATVRGYRLEGTDPDRTRLNRFRDTWTFQRPASLTSLPASRLVALTCPACGAAGDQIGPDVVCGACGVDLVSSVRNWRATGVKGSPVVGREDLPTADQRSLAVSLPIRGVAEAQRLLTTVPSVVPGFDHDQWRRQAVALFQIVMGAWRPEEWRLVRPWCTDAAFEQLRAVHEPIQRQKRTRVMQGVRLQRSDVVGVELDPQFATITLRFWYRLREYVTDEAGEVASGDPDNAVEYSVCWTFLRQVGQLDSYPDLGTCPVCTASVDRVTPEGVCGNCGSPVTMGEVRWVLSAVDSVEDWHTR